MKKRKSNNKKNLLSVILLIVGIISFAIALGEIPYLFEVETNGTNSGGAIVGDASASGANYVQFTDAGDYWEFSTNMSAISILVAQSLYGTIFDVYIDDMFYGTFNSYETAGTVYQKKLNIFNFLDGDNHTIKINHTGWVNPSGQKNVDLDAFIVNSTLFLDIREAEDEWSNRSGAYITETTNNSGDAIFQLSNSTSYWQAYGSGKYLFIYTKNSPSSSFFNVTYNGQQRSFDTYENGYLYKQKHKWYLNTTDANYLLRINNSGINNTENNSGVDLDYIVFYPWDNMTSNQVNSTNNVNLTSIDLTWNASVTNSTETITYSVYAKHFENTTSEYVTNTTNTSVILNMVGKDHDYYRFFIESSDGYLSVNSSNSDSFFYFDNKTTNQRAIQAADYLVRNQRSDGAIPDAFDSSYFNSDNNAGYAGIALYYAWKNSSNNSYIDALGSHLDWLAARQESDGTWHYSYQYNSTNSSYYPVAWPVYLNSNITDIKVVDAIQAYFAYDLWLYSLSGRNNTKVTNLTTIAQKGIDRLIADNYDGSKFFYSSWQYRNTTNNWTLYEIKYSSGQVDVYLGLMGLWNLTNNDSYLNYSRGIRNNFDAFYWNQTSSSYSIGLGSTNGQDATEYLFPQAYVPIVFGTTMNNSLNSYNYIKQLENIDGSINSTTYPLGETLFSEVTSMAATKLNTGNNTNLTNYLLRMQVDSTLNSSGGVRNDKVNPYLYTNLVAFYVPALLNETLDVPNYVPVFNTDLTTQSVSIGSQLSYQITCIDLDGDNLTYYDNSPLVNINSTSGIIFHTPISSEIGSYVINITCSDGKINSSQLFTYAINLASSSETTRGTSLIKSISEEKISEGYTTTFIKNQGIIFKKNRTSHRFTLKGLTKSTANILISSTPQEATLFVGDIRKFDLEGDFYYDLSVRLNSIKNNKANITLLFINESITLENIKEEIEKEEKAKESSDTESDEEKARMILLVLMVFAILSLLLIIYKIHKTKKHKDKRGIMLIDSTILDILKKESSKRNLKGKWIKLNSKK